MIEQVQVDILGKQAEKNSGNISKTELKEILEKYFTDVPEEIPEDLTTVELTAKEEYGSEKIKLSEIWTGEFEEEAPVREPIEETEGYTANYLDTDGDGEADGIIFADLAVGGSGQWKDSDGNYSYEAKTGLKEYYVEEENYDGEAKFGSVGGKLIAPVEGTSGEDRFYIMALEDINPGTGYCWYDAAYGAMSDYAETTSQDFETGKTNTETMLTKWNAEDYGPKNDNSRYEDMWGVVEEEINKKKENSDKATWFIASRAEWAAFGDMVTEKLGVTTSNYDTYGLSSLYWSSSQRNANLAYSASFNSGFMRNDSVDRSRYVRLCATF